MQMGATLCAVCCESVQQQPVQQQVLVVPAHCGAALACSHWLAVLACPGRVCRRLNHLVDFCVQAWCGVVGELLWRVAVASATACGGRSVPEWRVCGSGCADQGVERCCAVLCCCRLRARRCYSCQETAWGRVRCWPKAAQTSAAAREREESSFRALHWKNCVSRSALAATGQLCWPESLEQQQQQHDV
jgi:hypothetical protein